MAPLREKHSPAPAKHHGRQKPGVKNYATMAVEKTGPIHLKKGTR
jgi:hypothetical protein